MSADDRWDVDDGRIGQVESDRERIERLVRERDRLRATLNGVIQKRGLSAAPCDVCGYSGPGYYQPDQHPCAALRRNEG